MATEFKLPELGENIEAGDVVRVAVSPGDTVHEGQTVVELETDKAVLEVPSTVNGKIDQVAVQRSQKVKAGDVLFTYTPADNKAATAEKPQRQHRPVWKAHRLRRRQSRPKKRLLPKPRRRKRRPPKLRPPKLQQHKNRPRRNPRKKLHRHQLRLNRVRLHGLTKTLPSQLQSRPPAQRPLNYGCLSLGRTSNPAMWCASMFSRASRSARARRSSSWRPTRPWSKSHPR